MQERYRQSNFSNSSTNSIRFVIEVHPSPMPLLRSQLLLLLLAVWRCGGFMEDGDTFLSPSDIYGSTLTSLCAISGNGVVFCGSIGIGSLAPTIQQRFHRICANVNLGGVTQQGELRCIQDPSNTPLVLPAAVDRFVDFDCSRLCGVTLSGLVKCVVSYSGVSGDSISLDVANCTSDGHARAVQTVPFVSLQCALLTDGQVCCSRADEELITAADLAVVASFRFKQLSRSSNDFLAGVNFNGSATMLYPTILSSSNQPTVTLFLPPQPIRTFECTTTACLAVHYTGETSIAGLPTQTAAYAVIVMQPYTTLGKVLDVVVDTNAEWFSISLPNNRSIMRVQFLNSELDVVMNEVLRFPTFTAANDNFAVVTAANGLQELVLYSSNGVGTGGTAVPLIPGSLPMVLALASSTTVVQLGDSGLLLSDGKAYVHSCIMNTKEPWNHWPLTFLTRRVVQIGFSLARVLTANGSTVIDCFLPPCVIPRNGSLSTFVSSGRTFDIQPCECMVDGEGSAWCYDSHHGTVLSNFSSALGPFAKACFSNNIASGLTVDGRVIYQLTSQGPSIATLGSGSDLACTARGFCYRNSTGWFCYSLGQGGGGPLVVVGQFPGNSTISPYTVVFGGAVYHTFSSGTFLDVVLAPSSMSVAPTVAVSAAAGFDGPMCGWSADFRACQSLQFALAFYGADVEWLATSMISVRFQLEGVHLLVSTVTVEWAVEPLLPSLQVQSAANGDVGTVILADNVLASTLVHFEDIAVWSAAQAHLSSCTALFRRTTFSSDPSSISTAFISATSSWIGVDNSVGFGGRSIGLGGLLAAINSTVLMRQSSFSGFVIGIGSPSQSTASGSSDSGFGVPPFGGAVLAAFSSFVNVFACNFSLNRVEDPFGAGGAIISVLSSITMLDVECHANVASGGGCLAVYGLSTTTLNGGLVYLGEQRLDISSSRFYNNTAMHAGGGALLVVNSDECSIIGAELINNTAAQGDGGAVLADRSVVNITNSRLASNRAIVGGGGAAFSQPASPDWLPLLQSNVYEQSTDDAAYGPVMGTPPTTISFAGFEHQAQVSGAVVVPALQATVVDQYGQPALTDFTTVVVMRAANSSATAVGGAVAVVAQAGLITFDSLIVTSVPGQPALLIAQSIIGGVSQVNVFNVSLMMADCDRGTFVSTTARTCQQCSAGRISSSQQAFDCMPCDGGTYSNAGSSTCSTCAAGFVSGPNAAQCNTCAAGRFSASSQACDPCPVGFFSSAPGQGACTQCAAGRWAGGEAVDCDVCPPGRFAASNQGSCITCGAGTMPVGAACVECGNGTFSPDGTACTSCPIGQYSGQIGASACTPCDRGLEALQSGSAECSPCRLGFVKLFASPFNCDNCGYTGYTLTTGQLKCIPCTAGLQCVGGIATSLPDYWPIVETAADGAISLTAAHCPPNSCLGGGGVDGPRCAANRFESNSSLLCSSCLPGYSALQGGACTPCSAPHGFNILLVILLSWASVVVLHRLSQSSTGEMRVLLFFISTARSLAGPATGYLGWIGLLEGTPTPGAWMSLCLAPMSGLQLMLLNICLVFGGFGLLLLTAGLHRLLFARRRTVERYSSRCFEAMGLNQNEFPSWEYHRTAIALIVYSYSSLTLGLSVFLRCERVGSRLVLAVNAEVDCESSSYQVLRTIVSIVLVVWLVLLPITVAVGLYLKRSQRDEPSFRQRWGVLFLLYKPTAYLTEPLLLVRRVSLSLVVLLAPDAFQSLLAAAVMLLWLVLNFVLHPYAESAHNNLEALSLFALTLIAICMTAVSEAGAMPLGVQVSLTLLISIPALVVVGWIVRGKYFGDKASKDALAESRVDDGTPDADESAGSVRLSSDRLLAHRPSLIELDAGAARRGSDGKVDLAAPLLQPSHE